MFYCEATPVRPATLREYALNEWKIACTEDEDGDLLDLVRNTQLFEGGNSLGLIAIGFFIGKGLNANDAFDLWVSDFNFIKEAFGCDRRVSGTAPRLSDGNTGITSKQ